MSNCCDDPVDIRTDASAQAPLGKPDRDRKTFALIGNPNCGKTTLFNELTGTKQRGATGQVSPWKKKIGTLRPEYGDADIVDLPGIYSLTSYSIEERGARFIIDERPDVVIDIVEATNIERNLFLTCQIAELGVPLVVAVNMMDEARAAGDVIDCRRALAPPGRARAADHGGHRRGRYRAHAHGRRPQAHGRGGIRIHEPLPRRRGRARPRLPGHRRPRRAPARPSLRRGRTNALISAYINTKPLQAWSTGLKAMRRSPRSRRPKTPTAATPSSRRSWARRSSAAARPASSTAPTRSTASSRIATWAFPCSCS